MIVIQFRKDLLPYSLTEQNRLCAYTKSVTILLYCRHLTVIQIDDLPVTAHKRCLLFFEILRIDAWRLFLFPCH